MENIQPKVYFMLSVIFTFLMILLFYNEPINPLNWNFYHVTQKNLVLFLLWVVTGLLFLYVDYLRDRKRGKKPSDKLPIQAIQDIHNPTEAIKIQAVKFVIDIKGGLIVNIAANQDIKYVIVDHDAITDHGGVWSSGILEADFVVPVIDLNYYANNNDPRKGKLEEDNIVAERVWRMEIRPIPIEMSCPDYIKQPHEI